jgi:nitrogen fixation/metabolism regulation signal transduction histidine kinase
MRGRPTKNPHTRPAINTLERLYMELGGQILENRQRYDELSHQMRHVEAIIKMLDPGYNLARITVKRRQPNKWFKRGTLYRRAVDVLRTATGPMTTAEIGAAILAAEGIEATKADAQAVALSIQHSLKNHEGRGVEIVGEARPARWRLKGAAN